MRKMASTMLFNAVLFVIANKHHLGLNDLLYINYIIEYYSTVREREKALHTLIRSNHQDILEIKVKLQNSIQHVSISDKEGVVVLENVCMYLLIYTWTVSGKICQQQVTDWLMGNIRGVAGREWVEDVFRHVIFCACWIIAMWMYYLLKNK